MKHYLPIISAFIILFSSCSKEDDILIDEPTTPQLCVKRTVEYFGYSNNLEFDRRISDYNYDGTRLLDWKETRINNNGTTTQTFTNVYTGDNITSMIVSYTRSWDDNVFEIYYDFEYDTHGRLTKRFEDGNLYSTYTYVGYTVEQYDSNNILIGEKTHDSDYNMIGWKSKQASDSNWTRIVEIEHDDKNMPFKNVLTWYPLSGYRYISPNNTTNVSYVLSTSIFYPTGTTIDMDISYDVNDFPTYIATSYSNGRSKSETLEYNN